MSFLILVHLLQWCKFFYGKCNAARHGATLMLGYPDPDPIFILRSGGWSGVPITIFLDDSLPCTRGVMFNFNWLVPSPTERGYIYLILSNRKFFFFLRPCKLTWQVRSWLLTSLAEAVQKSILLSSISNEPRRDLSSRTSLIRPSRPPAHQWYPQLHCLATYKLYTAARES